MVFGRSKLDFLVCKIRAIKQNLLRELKRASARGGGKPSLELGNFILALTKRVCHQLPKNKLKFDFRMYSTVRGLAETTMTVALDVDDVVNCTTRFACYL